MFKLREDILNHVICIVWNSWNKKFEIFELSKTVLNIKLTKLYCVISACICNNSGPLFLATGLNMERYGVSLGIESEFGKIWSRKTPNTNTFYDTVRIKDDNHRKQSNSSKYFKVEWKSSFFAILLSVNTNLAFVEDLVKITNY